MNCKSCGWYNDDVYFCHYHFCDIYDPKKQSCEYFDTENHLVENNNSMKGEKE